MTTLGLSTKKKLKKDSKNHKGKSVIDIDDANEIKKQLDKRGEETNGEVCLFC